MGFITAENYGKAGVYTITVNNNKNLFRVRMIDVQNGLGIKNISDLSRQQMCGIYETKSLTKEQKKNYIKTKKEICNSLENDYKYARSDIMERIIKNCRGVKRCNDNTNRKNKEVQRQNFRSLLGFNENDIFQSKESSVLSKITTIFSTEKIVLQHHVLGYYIDAYFPKHKLAIEIDEQGHQDRDIQQEIERQKAIVKELECEFIRINPDKKDFDIFVEISKIQSYIIESTKELTKKTNFRRTIKIRV